MMMQKMNKTGLLALAATVLSAQRCCAGEACCGHKKHAHAHGDAAAPAADAPEADEAATEAAAEAGDGMMGDMPDMGDMMGGMPDLSNLDADTMAELQKMLQDMGMGGDLGSMFGGMGMGGGQKGDHDDLDDEDEDLNPEGAKKGDDDEWDDDHNDDGRDEEDKAAEEAAAAQRDAAAAANKANPFPALKTVNTREELDELIAKRPDSAGLYVFVGKADMKEVAGQFSKNVKRVESHTAFFQSDAEQTMTVYRGQNEVETYAGELSTSEDALKELHEFAYAARVPSYGRMTQENFSVYVEKAEPGMVFFCPEAKALAEAEAAVAAGEEGAQDKLLAALKHKEFSQLAQEHKDMGMDATYPVVYVDNSPFGQNIRKELDCSKTGESMVMQQGSIFTTEEEDTHANANKKEDANGKEEEPKEKLYIRHAEDGDVVDTAAVKKFIADIASGALKFTTPRDELDEMDDKEEEEDDKKEAANDEL